MSDAKPDKDAAEEAAPKKKKGGMKKILLIVIALLVVIGGGVGGALYAMNAGLIGGGHGKAAEPEGPKLVPKSEQKRVGSGGEGGGAAAAGHKPPAGVGGDKYASNYYAMDKEFTSNLKDSIHFVQVGIAVSTPYDDTVVENIKTNEIAVRSAVLMALGDTTEEQVFSSTGKEQLQRRITKAINDMLRTKEGFGGIGNTYFTSFVVQ